MKLIEYFDIYLVLLSVLFSVKRRQAIERVNFQRLGSFFFSIKFIGKLLNCSHLSWREELIEMNFPLYVLIKMEKLLILISCLSFFSHYLDIENLIFAISKCLFEENARCSIAKNTSRKCLNALNQKWTANSNKMLNKVKSSRSFCYTENNLHFNLKIIFLSKRRKNSSENLHFNVRLTSFNLFFCSFFKEKAKNSLFCLNKKNAN